MLSVEESFLLNVPASQERRSFPKERWIPEAGEIINGFDSTRNSRAAIRFESDLNRSQITEK